MKGKFHYGPYNHFCPWGYFLHDDSTFTFEGNCEGRAESSLGNWHLTKDSIEVSSFEKSPTNIAFHVYCSKYNNKAETTFIILDKGHKPIENFLIEPFNNQPGYTYKNEYGFLLNSDADFTRDEFEKFHTDSSGILKIKKGISDSLDFAKLNLLAGKNFRIRNHNLPDTIKLTINMDGRPFYYDALKYEDGKSTFKFRYANGKMVF
ncbi:hypothetical protein [Mucilaginibacter agri]|uniref:Uncharacterized protein n=1 Tax=Mucilaginibacter agri TaxID=2695265 RepID=A0A966DR77_9SPHI|nr:hypothetical protein [Mucilaginibacter agri]NCD68200.1 hypothetical protein [Mucilaginibacter agri]